MASIFEITKKAFDKVEEYKKWNALAENERVLFETTKQENVEEQKRFDIIVDSENKKLSDLKELNDKEQLRSDSIKTEIDVRSDKLSNLNKEIKEANGKITGTKNALIEATMDFESKKSKMSNEITTIERNLQDLAIKQDYEQTRNSALTKLNDELEAKAKENMIQQSLDAEEYEKLKSKLKEAKRIISKANGGI